MAINPTNPIFGPQPSAVEQHTQDPTELARYNTGFDNFSLYGPSDLADEAAPAPVEERTAATAASVLHPGFSTILIPDRMRHAEWTQQGSLYNWEAREASTPDLGFFYTQARYKQLNPSPSAAVHILRRHVGNSIITAFERRQLICPRSSSPLSSGLSSGTNG